MSLITRATDAVGITSSDIKTDTKTYPASRLAFNNDANKTGIEAAATHVDALQDAVNRANHDVDIDRRYRVKPDHGPDFMSRLAYRLDTVNNQRTVFDAGVNVGQDANYTMNPTWDELKVCLKHLGDNKVAPTAFAHATQTQIKGVQYWVITSVNYFEECALHYITQNYSSVPYQGYQGVISATRPVAEDLVSILQACAGYEHVPHALATALGTSLSQKVLAGQSPIGNGARLTIAIGGRPVAVCIFNFLATRTADQLARIRAAQVVIAIAFAGDPKMAIHTGVIFDGHRIYQQGRVAFTRQVLHGMPPGVMALARSRLARVFKALTATVKTQKTMFNQALKIYAKYTVTLNTLDNWEMTSRADDELE